MKDFYYILGIDANCTSIEIKEAYRKLSKKFHPDLNQNDKYFENRFREIQEAYETLNNPVYRARYDAELKKFKSGSTNQPSSQNYNYKPPRGTYYQPRPATTYKSKTSGIDILFTIILIIITLIFGDYVLKAMNPASKISKVSSAVVAKTVSYFHPKHHKKRHVVNTQPALAVVNAAPVVIIKAVRHKVNQDTDMARVFKPVAVVIKPAQPSVSFLYATNIHSNLTGVTNMHEKNNFSSAIIKQIPTNSKVLVLEKGNSYYKVLFDNQAGYVPKWTLTEK